MKYENEENKRETPGYFMVIPSEIWSAEITAKAMILYGHISVLANKHKYCWAENSYFTKIMNISESVLCRAFNELEDEGFITRQFIYHPGTKQIKERRILLNINTRSSHKNEYRSGHKNEYRSGHKNGKDNSTSNLIELVNNIQPSIDV